MELWEKNLCRKEKNCNASPGIFLYLQVSGTDLKRWHLFSHQIDYPRFSVQQSKTVVYKDQGWILSPGVWVVLLYYALEMRPPFV